MDKRIITTAFLVIAAFVVKAQCNVDIIDSTIYKIEKLPSIVFNNIFSFKATGSPITKLISIRPLPLCNLYQHNPYKFNLEKNIHVELVTDADTTNAFLRQTITDGGRLNKLNNQGLICTDVCVVQPHKVTVDFKKIKKIYPYDTQSTLYKTYTAEQLPDIAVNNTKAKATAEFIWKKSKGNVIKYARKCYEAVAESLKYHDDPDMLSFEEIITRGGGNCGSFASVYVTLLRIKGIPARHVIALLQNRGYHVWAEFYLERYGWIPVDPTWKNGNMKEDYFGRYDGSAVVIGRGIYVPLKFDDGTVKSTRSLQNGWPTYWWNGPQKPEFYFSHDHTSWKME